MCNFSKTYITVCKMTKKKCIYTNIQYCLQSISNTCTVSFWQYNSMQKRTNDYHNHNSCYSCQSISNKLVTMIIMPKKCLIISVKWYPPILIALRHYSMLKEYGPSWYRYSSENPVHSYLQNWSYLSKATFPFFTLSMS